MKKLFKVVMALLMLLCFAGCSSDDSQVNNDQSSKVFHVGIVQIAQHDALDAATNGFIDELKKEFPDIDIDLQNASGDTAACSTIVNGFVNDGVDLIMANATPALQAAASATNSIPILGTSVTEYGIALGISDFNGVVGGNISGTSDLANLEQQAQIILDLIPNVKTVGILFCSSEDNSVYQVKVVKKYLEEKGIKVVENSFTESNDIALVTSELCSQVDAIYIPTDNAAASFGDTIDGVARNAGIPIVTGEENTAAKCGVATQSIDYYDLGVITGKMAVKILKGEANIAEMPVEYYSDYFEEIKKFNPVICEALNIEIPDNYEAIE